MCGIAGFIDPGCPEPEASERLRRMLALIAHRGPDGEGTHLAPDLGLAMGMRRLSIIDLEGGRQPIWNEDETGGRGLQRGDLQLRGAAPRAARARAPSSARRAIRRCSCICMRSTGPPCCAAARHVRLCHPRSARSGGCSSRAITSGRSRCTTARERRAPGFCFGTEVPARAAVGARGNSIPRRFWITPRGSRCLRRARISATSASCPPGIACACRWTTPRSQVEQYWRYSAR